MKAMPAKLLFCLVFGTMISCNEPAQEQEKSTRPAKKEKQEKKPVLEAEETMTDKVPDNDRREVPFDETPYKFDLDLPRSWKLFRLGEETLDYCDYEATLPNGIKVLDIGVLLNTRFDAENIGDLYAAALKLETVDISYKLQKDNWFIISGIDKKTKNIIYWKRVFGEMYVGDLHFEYPKTREAEIAPHIGTIAKSFTCD